MRVRRGEESTVDVQEVIDAHHGSPIEASLTHIGELHVTSGTQQLVALNLVLIGLCLCVSCMWLQGIGRLLLCCDVPRPLRHAVAVRLGVWRTKLADGWMRCVLPV